MPTIETVEESLIEECQFNYSKFMNNMIDFLMYYFSSRLHVDVSVQLQNNAEKKIAYSLFLLEKIHMYLFQRFLDEELGGTKQETNDLFSNHAYDRRLRLLQQIVANHTFIEKDTKRKCQKSLSQILNYFSQQNNVTFILSPLSPPWLSAHLQKNNE